MTKLIRVFPDLASRDISSQDFSDLCATVGMFDGLHLGHQKILNRVLEKKKTTQQSALICFYPHPVKIFATSSFEGFITTNRQRLSLLDDLGFDFLILLRFSRAFSKLDWRTFLDQALIRQLGVQSLTVGSDACFGKDREGRAGLIAPYLARKEIEFESLELDRHKGNKIGSGAIRKAVLAGDIEQACTLLGRPYAFEGKVQQGEKIGRSIGAPTVNCSIKEQIAPQDGVYISTLELDCGTMLPAITNVGIRPTVSKTKTRLVETHLLNSSKQLYGKRIQVHFLKRVRSEIEFESIVDLKTQIEKDIEVAKKFHGI